VGSRRISLLDEEKVNHVLEKRKDKRKSASRALAVYY